MDFHRTHGVARASRFFLAAFGLAIALPAAQRANAITSPYEPFAMPPVVLTRHAPTYPPQALRQHHQGTAILMTLVGVDGKPHDIKVEKSSGFKELDEAAVAAVWQWTFRPQIKAGVPTEGYLRTPVVFDANAVPRAVSTPPPAAGKK